jgi:hypothetical protein
MVDLPVLPDVLVCYPRAGSLGIHYPLAAGDLVLLIFCSRSLLGWRGQTDPTRPVDSGRDLTVTPLDGAVALPLSNHDSTPLSGGMLGSVIHLGESGDAFQFVAMSTKVASELSSMISTYNGHTHGGVTVGAGSSAIPSVTMSAVGDIAATKVQVS